MQLLVLVVALVALAKGDGGACDENLVQTLKTCADAINGGEALLVQMEKCAPNGCNYDCPSANKVDEQIKNLTATLKKLQISQAAIFDAFTANITDIINTVTKNTQDIGTINGGYNVCGTSGWTRVAYLDMSDPSQDCPTEFRMYNENGVRGCGRLVSSNPSCDSKNFSSNGITYSEMCGRVLGYQYATPDAIGSYFHGQNDIDSYYVDGISITHGSPRQHIWTYIVGISEYYNSNYDYFGACPCCEGYAQDIQTFIGDDYYCESGNPDSSSIVTLYSDDTLWDGKNCGSDEAPCCKHPDLPWFYKAFDAATNDDIEIRICGDEGTANEDTPVYLYEVFVK